MESREIIKKWFDAYTEYLVHCEVDPTKIPDAWSEHSNNLMEYWHLQEKGEVVRLYESFTLMIHAEIDRVMRINNDYRRNKRIDVVPNSVGGRYWL